MELGVWDLEFPAGVMKRFLVLVLLLSLPAASVAQPQGGLDALDEERVLSELAGRGLETLLERGSTAMNPWPFVIAAYAIALGGTAVLLAWSWLAMRRAETESEALGRHREA